MYGGGTFIWLRTRAAFCYAQQFIAHCLADEVNAVVIDVGSHSIKAGFAGEDAPKVLFPSVSISIELILALSPRRAINDWLRIYMTSVLHSQDTCLRHTLQTRTV